MFSVPSEAPTAARARWLAELADALDRAHQLLLELDLQPDLRPDALDLHFRIEAARLEVQLLRLRRSMTPGNEFGPEWTGISPWEPESGG